MVLAKKALKSTLLKTKNKQKKLRKIIFEVFLFIFYYFYTSTASNKAKRSATSTSVKLCFFT